MGCDFSSQSNQKILDAQKLLNEFRYQEAVIKYEEVVESIPKGNLKFKLLFQIGEIYSLYLNQPERARLFFDQIIKETEDPLWKVNSTERLADIEFSQFKNYLVSGELYEKLYKFFPPLEKKDLYEIRFAKSLVETDKKFKAREVLNGIIKNPGHQHLAQAYSLLGQLEFREKNWQKAVDFWLDYLKRETNEDYIIQAKYLIANTYETMEELEKAYNIYYSLLGEYPNQQVIRNRMRSIYTRRVDRKR